MSRVFGFLQDAQGIVFDIRRRTEEVLLYQRQLYPNVVCIQRWVRGHVTRIHLIRARDAAVKIQSYWRLYTALLEHTVTVVKQYEEMCVQHYIKMATKIQAFWRGYLVRKKVMDFSKRKAQLKACKQANEKMRETLQKIRENQVSEREKQIEEAADSWSKYILHKLHHLVRTKCQAGVLSLQNSEELSEVEQMIKSIKHKDFMTSLNKAKMEYIDKIYKEAMEKHKGFPKFLDLSRIGVDPQKQNEIEKPMEWPPCIKHTDNYRKRMELPCGARDLDEPCPFDRGTCECCEDKLPKPKRRPTKEEIRNRYGSFFSSMNRSRNSKPIILSNYRTRPTPPLSCQVSTAAATSKDQSTVSECAREEISEQSKPQSPVGIDSNKVKLSEQSKHQSPVGADSNKNSTPSSKGSSNKWKRIKGSSVPESKSSNRSSMTSIHDGSLKEDGSGDKIKIESVNDHGKCRRSVCYEGRQNSTKSPGHASKQWVSNKKTLSCISSCPNSSGK